MSCTVREISTTCIQRVRMNSLIHCCTHHGAQKAFCELYGKENINHTRTMDPVDFPTKDIQLDNRKYQPHTGGQHCKDTNTTTRNIGNTCTTGRVEFPYSLLHPLHQLGGILWAVKLGKYQPHTYISSRGIEHMPTTVKSKFQHSLFVDAQVANVKRITTR